MLKRVAVVLLALCPQFVTVAYAVQPQVITGGYRKIFASGPPPTPTYIGSAVNSQAGTISGPITVTYTPSGSGHALYVFGIVGVGTISSLTDSASTPTVVTGSTAWNALSGGGVYRSWLVSNASAGAHTFTLTAGASSSYGVLYVIELSNSSAAGSTSVSSLSNSSPNPIPCGSLSTNSGSIVLSMGMIYNGGATLTAGSGPPSFTMPTPTGTGFGFSAIEYSGATTATTYTISSGFGQSGGNDPYFCYAVEAKP